MFFFRSFRANFATKAPIHFLSRSFGCNGIQIEFSATKRVLTTKAANTEVQLMLQVKFNDKLGFDESERV